MSKYKAINTVRVGDKEIQPGEIVELTEKELISIPRNSSLELVETAEKKKGRKPNKEVK